MSAPEYNARSSHILGIPITDSNANDFVQHYGVQLDSDHFESGNQFIKSFVMCDRPTRLSHADANYPTKDRLSLDGYTAIIERVVKFMKSDI